ncbi:MAG: hypothetical protein ABH841_01050 [Candidatus Nealsonbacteria bacterium]
MFEVVYCIGEAVPKTGETGKVFSGGGLQYLFKDFDPSWLVETRRIPR